MKPAFSLQLLYFGKISVNSQIGDLCVTLKTTLALKNTVLSLEEEQPSPGCDGAWQCDEPSSVHLSSPFPAGLREQWSMVFRYSTRLFTSKPIYLYPMSALLQCTTEFFGLELTS